MAEPDEARPPAKAAADDVDPAAETGRLAGRVVNAVGMRLLRLRSVRRAIRRGVEEASDRPE